LTAGANVHNSGAFIKNGLDKIGDIVGHADSRNLGVGLAISTDGRDIAVGSETSWAKLVDGEVPFLVVIE
jgi:hypothetical protein